MEFILIWDWVDEDDGFLYEQHADFFATKEQLFEAKKKAEEEYSWQVAIGRLILSPAIGYSWADIDKLFWGQSYLWVTLARHQLWRLCEHLDFYLKYDIM